jgi:2-hydroxy-3-keto-5-methylthiopentenyl-1-phosphate phosphatase
MIIISDFSKTFTSPDMPTTWSVFAKSGVLWNEYIRERDQLFEQYHSYELDWDIAKTEEWFLKHAELFVKYQLTEEQIDSIVMDDGYFASRDGVAEFLDEIQSQDISLYIVSSGISQLIARWFELRFDYVPDIIVANELIIEDGVVVWVDADSIVCPLDKLIELEFEHWEQDIVLLGDSREDCMVVKNPTKSLGFIDEKWIFDMNLGRNTSMMNVFDNI